MLKIRLARTGKKGQPSYRIIVQEHSYSPKKGKYAEKLGYYLPTMDPRVFDFNEERINYWISVGAKPSKTLASLLKNAGVKGMEKFLSEGKRSRKKKKEVPEEAPAQQAEAPAEKAEEAPAEEAAA